MASERQLLNQFPRVQDQEQVTVVIPNYNGTPDIADAILSVQESTYPIAEIVVIDDGSTDDSVAFIRKHFPDVRLVELHRNSGGILNRVRNIGIAEAKTRLVFLMDHDVIVDPCCVSVLVTEMRTLPRAAALTTRAMYHHDRDRIYVDAQSIHFMCNTLAPTRDKGLSEAEAKPKTSVGWGTQLIDKTKASAIGFFDEDYVIGWGDDGEFHYKLLLSGLGCYSVPQAIVYHKRHSGADRFYAMIHNRWYLMIETYALKTLILLFPALLLYEIALFAFVILKGKLNEYTRALRDTLRHFPRLMSKRVQMQNMRQVPDRELLVSGPIYIRATLVNKQYLKLGINFINAVFNAYWNLVKRVI